MAANLNRFDQSLAVLSGLGKISEQEAKQNEKEPWNHVCRWSGESRSSASDESWKIPERRKRFLDRLDTEIEYLEKLVQNIEFEQRLNREAQVSITSLPPEQAANRILRYEAHIERQLKSALDQLERIQRRRRGEVIPPPLKVDI